MWKISKIRINNIVSLEEAELKFKQGVATLIFGKNEDNASQPCNGSGKSSLVEAISFALTGEQLRKVKSLEEIIHDTADSAYVYLCLENDFDGTSFTIERTISRNAPQVIECHKFDANGMEIESDKTVQPTVLDYNRFILSEIGLTKDEIYNNYILCDNKYTGFFDSTDREKKEIINNFCNGVMVDESIEKVNADLAPITQELNDVNMQLAKTRGSVSAIEQELAGVGEKVANAKIEKEKRIASFDEFIRNARVNIEDAQINKTRGEERLNTLKAIRSQIYAMEADNNLSLLQAYDALSALCKNNNLGDIQDYSAKLHSYVTEVQALKEELAVSDGRMRKSVNECEFITEEIESKTAEHDKYVESAKILDVEDEDLQKTLNEQMTELENSVDALNKTIKENEVKETQLKLQIARNEALLDGAVTCPKCNHSFFVEEKKSVADVVSSIVDLKASLGRIQDSIEKMQNDCSEQDAKADELYKDWEASKYRQRVRTTQIEQLKLAIFNVKQRLLTEQGRSSAYESEINRVATQISLINVKTERLRSTMFNEVLEQVESRISKGENHVSTMLSNIEFHTGRLTQYQQDKEKLINTPDTDFSASLKESLEKYTAQLAQQQDIANKLQGQVNVLEEQKNHFTQFKSYIARKKIDALSLIVNDFLEKIGSDIRLKLEGYTMTKTGKLRDKISVQVMRDGIDCGSFQKFSGGEKARLNLACILSLHTLTNANCEEGKGLDFLVIDELLDKSDEVGMATYCEALNKLGQTSLLITQGAVAESYPHKLLIVKRQGVSSILDYNNE